MAQLPFAHERPFEEIEDALKANPPWIPSNLFPNPLSNFAIDYFFDDSMSRKLLVYSLQKQSTSSFSNLYPRLDRLRNSQLYILNDFRSSSQRMNYEGHFTRSILLGSAERASLDYYQIRFGDPNQSAFDGHVLVLPAVWERILGKEQVKEFWMEFNLKVDKNCYPVGQPVAYARPIALRTQSNLYLIVLSECPPNTPRKFDASDKIKDELFVLSPTKSRRSVRPQQTSAIVRSYFLQRLQGKFAGPPLFAEVDESIPDELIMIRNYKQNTLLDSKYEQSGYTLRVYGDETISVLITYNVLTANHPRNKFYDPSPQEFGRYGDAIRVARRLAQEETCWHFGGVLQNNVCTIGDR
jgi:hypothetical protein